MDNFSQELRNINAENKMMLEESTDHCQQLLSSLKNVSQDTDKWGELATAQIISVTDQHLLSFSDEKKQLMCSQQVHIAVCSLMQHSETNFYSRICRGTFSIMISIKWWCFDNSRLMLINLNAFW